jgi:hypothetical protein
MRTGFFCRSTSWLPSTRRPSPTRWQLQRYACVFPVCLPSPTRWQLLRWAMRRAVLTLCASQEAVHSCLLQVLQALYPRNHAAICLYALAYASCIADLLWRRSVVHAQSDCNMRMRTALTCFVLSNVTGGGPHNRNSGHHSEAACAVCAATRTAASHCAPARDCHSGHHHHHKHGECV